MSSIRHCNGPAQPGSSSPGSVFRCLPNRHSHRTSTVSPQAFPPSLHHHKPHSHRLHQLQCSLNPNQLQLNPNQWYSVNHHPQSHSQSAVFSNQLQPILRQVVPPAPHISSQSRSHSSPSPSSLPSPSCPSSPSAVATNHNNFQCSLTLASFPSCDISELTCHGLPSTAPSLLNVGNVSTSTSALASAFINSNALSLVAGSSNNYNPAWSSGIKHCQANWQPDMINNQQQLHHHSHPMHHNQQKQLHQHSRQQSAPHPQLQNKNQQLQLQQLPTHQKQQHPSQLPGFNVPVHHRRCFMLYSNVFILFLQKITKSTLFDS
ncbi:unnamed protein product [Protopolystoma xenopodis]|uniref:Uncharacterized protein n=1 Tax=Protopolystoma xenopodis TaxID=117903 RepID=A0A448X4R8_9PLAT|nr:unnamed protein product [Protopolystoma xenopodis]